MLTSIMKRQKWLLLTIIFIIAIIFRFYSFKESIYFSFDQARDIYISQDIYLKGNLKLIGPPVSGNIGLFHGVFFWYFLGPVSLLSKGDPVLISALFRVINALGIFLVFAISKNLFNIKIGLLSALLFATSYEESQYSFFVSNPSLAVLAVLLIFYAASWLTNKDKKSNWSPVLMFIGAALATQFNLIYIYTFILVFIILLLYRKEALKIKFKYYLYAFLSTIFILSTYILTEIRYGFRSIKLAHSLFQQNFGILNPNESKYSLFLRKYLIMFKDNILGLIDNKIIIVIIVTILTFLLFTKAKKDKKYTLLLIWIFGWIFLMLIGGHLAYYTNAGLSIPILIFTSILLEKLFKVNKPLMIFFICIVILGNIKQIKNQSPNSLLVEFAPQVNMKLSDEYKIIDQMYQQAQGNGFTVRLTGIPYKVQTVWAYLFNYYGQKKYGYLPFWETGNTLGFPGTLPIPQNGTTCYRFRVVEPANGLPESLINDDLKIEEYFSNYVDKIKIGDFLLETRQAKDNNCHSEKAIISKN